MPQTVCPKVLLWSINGEFAAVTFLIQALVSVCKALGVYSLRLSVAASTAAMVVLITLFVTVIKIRQPCWCMIRYR